MNKYILTFTLFLSFLMAKSQSVNWEGEVHYVTTYTYFPEALKGYKDYLPVTMDIYIRKNLVCKEGPTGLANGYQIHITNLATQNGYTAMTVADNQVAYRKGPAEYASESEAMPIPTSIEYVNETRTIAGFPCKKALVYLANSSKPFTVFYTNQLPSEAYIVYKGLKGFPLYFEGSMNGVTFYSEAKSVNPTKQADSKFLLPQEYHIVSYEEFKSTLIKDVN